MTTRFVDHLLEGDHASRPAFGSVPQGTLYACSDHALIYQSDGVAAWSTWATLGGDVSAHLADATDAHDASAVSFSPTGTIAATDVQAAIAEVASEAGAPAFVGVRARAVADVALTSGTLVPITYDTEDWDTDGFHSTVTNTSRFTVPSGKDGRYEIRAGGFASATSFATGDCAIRKNGATYIIPGIVQSNTSISAAHASGMADLVATDYVEFMVRASAASKNMLDGGSADPFFELTRVA